ncbi:hypothetical protein SAMN05216567_113152 [Variovorax sp. OK605]|jgi:hypothetical protein|uniref:hypothetical protein n=1 Tax=Variovorax sp. OK605 TaxID=1855317 RepID=UPI0008E06346|nr:hypothetical protein [Variovorax sp. OK605]SFQ30632.1 hypothetical protein SAMN05216567_113152 [Variovorax sp. OK605]
MVPQTAGEEISVVYDGVTYTASCRAADGMVTVNSMAFGSGTANAGWAPRVIARLMLRQMLDRAKHSGALAQRHIS